MSGDAYGSGLRIGDAERDLAAAALGEHFAAGRLDSEEYDERVGRVWAARTRADLPLLFDDLPGGTPDRLRLGPPPMPHPPAGAGPKEHWVADPSAWRQRGRAVTSKAATLPTWLLVIAGIVLVPVVLSFVLSALPFLLAGAAAWFFLAGPGRCGSGGHGRWKGHAR